MAVGSTVIFGGSVVGEKVGAIVVGVLDGSSVLIVGFKVGEMVGADVLGGTVGIFVGTFVGFRVVGDNVGDVVGISVVVSTGAIVSIALMRISMDRSVKLHTILPYRISSSPNSSFASPFDRTERWALSPTQQEPLSSMVSSKSNREHRQARV